MAKQREYPKDYPITALIEGVVMANGEFIHYGVSLGFLNQEQIDQLEKGANRIARGEEPIVALGDHIA